MSEQILQPSQTHCLSYWPTLSETMQWLTCDRRCVARNMTTDLSEFVVVSHFSFITLSVYMINPLDYFVHDTPPLLFFCPSISYFSLQVNIIIWTYLPTVAGGFSFPAVGRLLFPLWKQWLMMHYFKVGRNDKHTQVLKNINCIKIHSVANIHYLLSSTRLLPFSSRCFSLLLLCLVFLFTLAQWMLMCGKTSLHMQYITPPKSIMCHKVVSLKLMCACVYKWNK